MYIHAPARRPPDHVDDDDDDVASGGELLALVSATPDAAAIESTVSPCAATRALIMVCASRLLPWMNAPNPTHRTPAVVRQPARAHTGRARVSSLSRAKFLAR